MAWFGAELLREKEVEHCKTGCLSCVTASTRKGDREGGEGERRETMDE